MQALKNIVINGAMILALLFGLTISATAARPSFEEAKLSAEKGNTLGQVMLGYHYSDGLVVQQDYSKAFYWYQKAANQGDKFGQFNIGYAYANGQGVLQDYSKALEWFKKSAAQNMNTAQSYIGMMYEYGQGVRQNKTTAKEWHGKACDGGYVYGCQSYKRLHELGY